MSQFNAPTYDIERPSGQCAFTGRELQPGEAYIAALVDVEPTPQNPSGLKRLDVSMDAWRDGQRPEHVFSHWKATVPEPSAKKKLFVDDGVLMNLLIRLADAEQPQRIAFRFVLALILMRKKLLRYDGMEKRPAADEQGQAITQDWWQMTPKLDVSKGIFGKWNESEKLTVLDPHLDEQQTLAVTQQLGEILEAEL
jgi:hypothetical protein